MNPGAVSSRPSVDTGRGVSRAATAVDTGKPTPTKTAADAGSVQDTVQLSGAATNPLSELSTSQLEDRAFEAKDAATASMGQMYEGISSLPEGDRQEVGRAMFYETASATGYYQTEGENGTRNMTAAELRAEAAGLSPEDKQDFQADVQGWAVENEIPSQMAMAQGAVGWAASNFDENAPQERQDQLLSIAQGGQGVWNANSDIVESATELNAREPGRGSGLYEALNQPVE